MTTTVTAAPAALPTMNPHSTPPASERPRRWLARVLMGAALLAPGVVLARGGHGGSHGGSHGSGHGATSSNAVSGNSANAARAAHAMRAAPAASPATRIVHGNGSNCLRRDASGNCVNYGYSPAAAPVPAAPPPAPLGPGWMSTPVVP